MNPQDLPRILPHVSVDCVIFGFHENQLKVLLLRWKVSQRWSLPGGRVFRDEDVDAAAQRVLRERTGLHELFLQQFHTFGSAKRLDHPDFKKGIEQLGFASPALELLVDRTVSVGYYALVEYSQVQPMADALTEECRWWDIEAVPADLLLDHFEIVQLALQHLRRQLHYQPVGLNLLPEYFTMPELQRLYETVLGQKLDRANFQKRMLAQDVLLRTGERRMGGAHKAPFLYKFDLEKYREALANGGNAAW